MYLSLVVVLPLAAVVWRSGRDGWAAFWHSATTPQALAALRLTFTVALAVVAVNAVVGTLIAWVLVRDQFPGKAVVGALIDLPFALPTIVAGVTLLALYGRSSPVGINLAYSRPGVWLALAFVTLPFVVRSVQPVLLSIEPDMEEAARSLGAGPFTSFRRILLPTITPALLAGAALAFARAVGEFGSVVILSGNIPYRTEVASLHAFWLSLRIAGIAVPLNTLFGVACAVVLVRHRFPGKRLLDAFIDLPFAISPVVIGLALVLVYGQAGWLGGWLAERGVQVIFSLPGMVLATVFVSLPYVARAVAPVLREVGTEQEEAAWTLGASSLRSFLQVTQPQVRWGVAYGVVLTTARALGEFGAVTIVSGRLAGQTETMTLYVEDRFEGFDLVGAYAAALVLAGLALLILLAMTGLDRRGST